MLKVYNMILKTILATGLLFNTVYPPSVGLSEKEVPTQREDYIDKNDLYDVIFNSIDDTIDQTKKLNDEYTKEKEDKDFYNKIAIAAKNQIGVFQDCTMLVTNALRAVGIDFHGCPEEYLALGELTDTPVPGDICVYYGHVAIYIGNGKAVHGGWNGYSTEIYDVDCSMALIGYIHVSR